MSYSVDLRERVVAFVANGASKCEATRRFGVSRWCVYNWLSRECLQAQKMGPKAPWKLNLEALKAHIEEHPDAYLRERAVVLGVSDFAIRCGLKRLGIHRKKNAAVSREKRQSS